MLDYIWIDDKSPILKQIPKELTSAVILTSPFIQMPNGWAQSKRTYPNEHVYPEREDILNLAKPVTWSEIIEKTDLTTFAEVALASKTAISALNKKYARPDLAEKLKKNREDDLYYPHEDRISEFLTTDILKFYTMKGKKKIYYSEPIFDNSGFLQLSETTPSDLCDVYSSEVIVTDENMDYVFMSVYDSFINLFFSKTENAMEIAEKMGWEAIRVDSKSYITWYLNRTNSVTNFVDKIFGMFK